MLVVCVYVWVWIIFGLWNFKREKQQKQPPQQQPENKNHIHEKWISFRLPVFNILLKTKIAKIPCELSNINAESVLLCDDNKKFNLQNENTQKESYN